MSKIYCIITSVFLITIAFTSCNGDEIILPKPCSEEPVLDFNEVKMVLRSDTVIEKRIEVFSNGYFNCSGIIVKRGEYTKSTNITGSFCKNGDLNIDITYNDTVNFSKLKVIGKMNTENFALSGTVNYCPNTGNTCTFTEIGTIYGFYTDRYIGYFNTPLFQGRYDIYPLNNNLDSALKIN
jgi:hypothetical protein